MAAPGEPLVREQVRRLLQSEVLRSSETQRRLLSYLAERAAGLIRNLRPGPGEPASFPDQPRGDAETHETISRLPGLHGKGEVLIFASNLTGGTLGAVEYFTQPDYARSRRAAGGQRLFHKA